MNEENEIKCNCNYIVDVACVISVQIGGEPGDKVVTVEPSELQLENRQELMDAIIDNEEIKDAFKNLSTAVAYHRKFDDGKYATTKAYMTIANGVIEMVEV